jgi:hypothetical protein
MLWLFALAQARDCTVTEFDIHGEVRDLTPEPDKAWVYFGAGFGDFGHNVEVRVWNTSMQFQASHIYMTLDHSCPTNATRQMSESGVMLDGGTAQFATFGIDVGTGNHVYASIVSKVRPIHPNTATKVIYALFIFFGGNFLFTGIVQFYWFRTSMDPNEYQLGETHK